MSFFEIELVERVNFSDELGMFKFRSKEEFIFKPGQYATLVIQDGERLIQKPYSIVSSPQEPFLEFFIELVPGGELTPRIWELKVGDKISARKKMKGVFVLNTQLNMRNHLMAASVTGIAPFLSIVRTQIIELSKGNTNIHNFLILHGASRSWELGIYKDELLQLSQKYDWLTYIPTISRPWEDKEWANEVGRVDDIIRKYADQKEFNHTNTIAYACGHPQMIENVKAILSRSRFPKEQLKEEKYF